MLLKINREEMRQKQEDQKMKPGLKGQKSHYGFKLQSIVDKETQIIRRFATSTANLHDSQVDLSEECDTEYRARGYFDAQINGSIDKIMTKSILNHPISI
jgi:IS5 family transposase